MSKRLVIIVAALVVALGSAALAVGARSGLIWDDGRYYEPGSLDDGKELLPQTRITLAQAVAAAQRAWQGQLGQVDLERSGGGVVYMVDVGDQEVRVDASDGRIASISARD
jgi:uncharacterized membrane protein YkoI